MSRRNRPVSPARAQRCTCGRMCASAAGLRTHERTCPVERARSAAYVEAIEQGLSYPDLVARCAAAVRTARAAQAAR